MILKLGMKHQAMELYKVYINHDPGVSEKKMFEYCGHLHVYSPGAGADNPLSPKYFHKHKSSVHLLIPSKFSAIKLHFPIFFPIQMHG